MSNTTGKDSLHPAHAKSMGIFGVRFSFRFPSPVHLYSMNRTQSQAVFFAQKWLQR